VNLKIKYTEKYPDELPDIDIEPVEGELSELELGSAIEKLKEAVSLCLMFDGRCLSP
jgi:hypothetical protein